MEASSNTVATPDVEIELENPTLKVPQAASVNARPTVDSNRNLVCKVSRWAWITVRMRLIPGSTSTYMKEPTEQVQGEPSHHLKVARTNLVRQQVVHTEGVVAVPGKT